MLNGARESQRLRIGAASARRRCGSCWPENQRKPTFSPQRLPRTFRGIGAAATLRRVAVIVARMLGKAGRGSTRQTRIFKRGDE
jgi:hypothetical protein